MNQLTLEQAADLEVRINAHGIFEGLTPPQIAALEDIGVYMDYCRELVTADGLSQGYLFYVVEGDFEVSKVDPESQKKVVLAHIGKGQCFGEMSFLTGAPASANVMAMDRVICWAVPHDILREFIHTQEGGSILALQIAGLLATRLREGNTRLMGINNTLSAYFGCRSRMSNKNAIEAPQGNDHAEVEMPDELFIDFARETLKLPENAVPTNEQLEDVRKKIEADEVDIVPWLEQGQKGQPLTVRLRFAPKEEAPQPIKGAPKVPPKSGPLKRVPQVVRIPQVRAQITPTVAYVPLPPNPFWRVTSLASWFLFVVLAVVAFFSMTPLAKRERWAASPSFKDLPLQGLWNFVLFREQTQSDAVTLDESTSYNVDISVPKAVRIDVSMEMPKPMTVVKTITLKLFSGTEKDGVVLVDQTFDIPIGATQIRLISTHLQPGEYKMLVKGDEIAHGDGLQATIEVKYVH